METTWGQHEDNVEMTWGPQGCGDHMGTTWRQLGDHGDVETTWGQHGDNMRTMWIIQFCLKICDLLRHPHLCVDVWVVWWMGGLMDGSMGGSMGGTRSNH